MHWTQTLLATSLAVYLAAFVAAMVLVRHETGTSPVGQAKGQRAAALVSGIASILLLLTAIAYPIDARSVDWFGRISLLDRPVAQWMGAVALALAGVCIIWGELSLGHSFRVALPESKQTLVTHGIYRFMRNPLALSADLLALGTLLMAPSLLALASLVLNVLGYEWKIRIEEAYLREVHGPDYATYCAQTGRYLPRFPLTDATLKEEEQS